MTENDFPKFAELLQRVAKRTVTPTSIDLEDTVNFMFEILEEYPFELVYHAVKEYCKANKFFPAVSDIATQIEGSIEDRATVAWYQILKARKKFGLRKSIRFSTPATHFAIDRMCGWENLCDMITNSNASYMLRDFKVFYRLGERCATWRNVREYFPSDYERYELNMGRMPKRKVYDVESGHVIPDEMLSPIAPMAAWSQVMRVRYKECWNGVKNVKFPDPAIHYAIERMGGWENFCTTLNENTEDKKREEFQHCYLNYQSQEEVPIYLSTGGDKDEFFDVRTGRYIRLED